MLFFRSQPGCAHQKSDCAGRHNVFRCMNSFSSHFAPCDFSCSVLQGNRSTSELALCSMVAARDPTQRRPHTCAMTSSPRPFVDRCVARGAAAIDHGSQLDDPISYQSGTYHVWKWYENYVRNLSCLTKVVRLNYVFAGSLSAAPRSRLTSFSRDRVQHPTAQAMINHNLAAVQHP